MTLGLKIIKQRTPGKILLCDNASGDATSSGRIQCKKTGGKGRGKWERKYRRQKRRRKTFKQKKKKNL